MRFKLCPAFRTPSNRDIFSLAVKIRQQAHSDLRNVAKQIYNSWIESPPEDMGVTEPCPLDCSKYLSNRISSSKDIHSSMAIYVSLFVRRYENHFYFLPFSSFLGLDFSLKTLHEDPEIEDFSYDENDIIPGVTSAEWEERRQTWAKLRENWDDVINIEICDINTWLNHIDPATDMLHEKLDSLKKEERRVYMKKCVLKGDPNNLLGVTV